MKKNDIFLKIFFHVKFIRKCSDSFLQKFFGQPFRHSRVLNYTVFPIFKFKQSFFLKKKKKDFSPFLCTLKLKKKAVKKFV